MPDPQDTIELLRSAYDAFNRGDTAGSRQIFDPEIELIQPSELPGGSGAYRGLEGLDQALAELLEGFEEYRMEPEEFVVDGDLAAIVVHLRGRGRTSHLEVEARVGHLATLRDGRVVRWEVFLAPDEALAALEDRRMQ
jgi:ketosteroid isomerase-like protein